MSTVSDTATQSPAQGAAGGLPEQVRIVLTQNWDASLSYEVLRQDVDADPPVFVVRGFKTVFTLRLGIRG